LANIKAIIEETDYIHGVKLNCQQEPPQQLFKELRPPHMKLHNIILLTSFLVFGAACVNYNTAKKVINHPKEYTGIEQLIRIDGYYFESSEDVYSPFILKSNGGYLRYFFKFHSHDSFIDNASFLRSSKGSYTISNDTIKIIWANGFDMFSYHIHEEHFVIINDTTLNRVFYSINGEMRERKEGSNIMKFRAYDIDSLK